MIRIDALDLVRGLAAFVVAIAHYFVARNIAAQAAEVASVVAVEVFFVLSGFVLAPQILLCVSERRWQITATFLARRWLRTIPPYVVALTCATIVFQGVVSRDTLRYLVYAQNLFAQHNTIDYFPVAWSLSVEEWFYVVFPLALLAGTRTARLPHVVRFGVAFVAAIFLLRLMFGEVHDWGPAVRRVVVFRIDAIAYGFLLSLAIARVAVLRRTVVCAVALGVLLPAIALVVGPAAAGHPLAGHLFPLLAAAFGGSVIALAVAAQPAVERCRLGPLAVFLGRISYSVYLFHIIFVAVLLRFAPALPVTWHFLGYLSCLVVFGTGFYRFFERPILDGRPSYPGVRADRT